MIKHEHVFIIFCYKDNGLNMYVSIQLKNYNTFSLLL
jgi:hypothetical protein